MHVVGPVGMKLSHLSATACGLGLYAKIDADFEKVFLESVAELDLSPNRAPMDVSSLPESMGILIPPHLRAARARAEWLANEIRHATRERRDELCRAIQAIRCRELTAPQMIVFGLRCSIKYGPVAGDMIADKSNTTQIVCLHPHCSSWGKWKVARAVQKTSVGALSECLRIVDNDSSRFDPEVSDWLLGDRATEIYQFADSADIQPVLTGIEQLGLPHDTLITDEKETVFALKPAYAGSFMELTSGLIPISD